MWKPTVLCTEHRPTWLLKICFYEPRLSQVFSKLPKIPQISAKSTQNLYKNSSWGIVQIFHCDVFKIFLQFTYKLARNSRNSFPNFDKTPKWEAFQFRQISVVELVTTGALHAYVDPVTGSNFGNSLPSSTPSWLWHIFSHFLWRPRTD